MNSRAVNTEQQIQGTTYNADHPDQTWVAKGQQTAMNLKDQVKGGIASAKDSMVSAKEQVFGAPIKPIESGMPGRYHPHPETVEATVPGSTLMDRVKSGLASAQTSAQAGLTSAQAGLVSARDSIFGTSVAPIEQGMPGRNHPHPETYEVPVPTLLDRVKTGAQQGLVSTQAGLLSAKNAVFGEKVEPIEGGMPGRNHPHPETFEAPAPSLMEKVKGGLVSAQTTVQSGLISAQTGLFEAKKRVWGTKVEPIEGGMPGRNHPHPERFYAPTPSLIEKVKSTIVSAEKIAETKLFEAKKRVWGTKIEPIEGGMPGRNHPHPERFYAPTPSLMEKVKSTLVSAEKLAETGLFEAKKRVWGAKVEPIEGGMPGRNHPQAERFYAPAPTLMDKMKGGLLWAETSVQAGLVSAKDKVMSLTETVEPVEGGMPGRNHPEAETFEAPAPGLMDKVKGGLASTQLGLISAKERIFGKPETHPMEVQAHSEIEKESIDQDAVRDVLDKSLAKETVHPLQDMPGPGRNHPMADSLKAQDQGLLNKLSDKLKHVFIGEKDVTGGSV